MVLYRNLTRHEMRWNKVELTYDPDSGLATGTIPMAPGEYEYFVQGVDRWGNVSVLLDRGDPYVTTIEGTQAPLKIFLPMILK